MWAWIPRLLRIVPVLGPLVGGLFEKWTESRGRAAELRAEAELEEARAFRKGRISPRYGMRYVQIGVFLLFAAAVFLAVFFPSAMPGADLSRLRDLIDMGEGMAGKM